MADLGTCMACVTDIKPGMVSGRRCLGEAIARRLQTPRGGLIDDPNYGFDLSGELNDDVTQEDVARMSSSIVAECLKDERVFGATATVVFANGTLLVTIKLTDSAGPFLLVLQVTSVTLELLTVGK
jgi:hypothetical protein